MLYIAREGKYMSNVGNAYTFLFGQCNKAMQSKLQARTDFEMTIRNNPIELLKAIEEHMISYQENKYEMGIITDALRNLVNLKQKDNESLIDYTGRGPIKLTKFFTSMHTSPTAPTEAETKAYEKTACKQLYAYIYLTNADQNKYGTLIQGLSSQFSLGQDQYPKTIEDANSVLSSHQFDAAYAAQLKKRKEKGKVSKDKDKEEQEAPKMSFAQLKGRCYCCGKLNHKSPNCCYKNKPKANGLSTRHQR